ncbi:MAG: hypothetical protein ABEJ55_06565 [Halanaeroarchaeum sp.]
MRDSLRVHVNHQGPRSVAPETDQIDVDGPFDLVLENEGQPAHVHVSFDDALASAIDLDDRNRYVEEGEEEAITVDVESREAVRGLLTVATGYGAERAEVSVDVAAGSGGVRVDDELESLQVSRPEESDTEYTDFVPYGFVAIGVVVAAAILMTVQDPIAMAVSLLLLVATVAVAVYLSLSR